MSRPHGPAWTAWAVVVLAALPALRPVVAQTDSRDRPVAGGRLIYDASDDLDLIGDLWTDLPFSVGRRGDVFFSLDTRTSIERTVSDFTFLVHDFQYAADVGWRWRRGPCGPVRLSLFAGQRGKQAVDADGQAYVRYAAVGLESPAYRAGSLAPPPAGGRSERFSWRVAVGAVLEHREVQADLMLRGHGRLRLLDKPARPGVGLEFRLDSLLGDGGLDADIAAGPTVALSAGVGRAASFFAHFQHSRNPLGIEHSALLLGFEYAEDGTNRAPNQALTRPDIDGLLAGGLGQDERYAARLLLRFLSPRFIERIHAIVVVDANLLTAGDTGDLFYLYHAGFERPVRNLLPGVYFYHRSNHQFAEPNDSVTSINVLEAGVETADWHRTGRRPNAGRLGRLDGRIRVGLLIDSSFGEQQRWHARGGVRWALPLLRHGWAPFLRLEVEDGDVGRWSAAAGAVPGENWEIQFGYLEDDQLFAADHSAWLLSARYGF